MDPGDSTDNTTTCSGAHPEACTTPITQESESQDADWTAEQLRAMEELRTAEEKVAQIYEEPHTRLLQQPLDKEVILLFADDWNYGVFTFLDVCANAAELTARVQGLVELEYWHGYQPGTRTVFRRSTTGAKGQYTMHYAYTAYLTHLREQMTMPSSTDTTCAAVWPRTVGKSVHELSLLAWNRFVAPCAKEAAEQKALKKATNAPTMPVAQPSRVQVSTQNAFAQLQEEEDDDDEEMSE